MELSSAVNSDFTELMSALGYKFENPGLLSRALTHSSLIGSENLNLHSNERLEFLGDRVLGLVIAETLLERFPNEDEGEISRRHAALVRMETLEIIGNELNLGNFVYMSRGEEHMGGRKQPTLIANTCEAVIAAIYIDGGLKNASNFIKVHWEPIINNTLFPPKDAKTLLQEWAQKRGLPLPTYWEIERDGPAHEPIFTVGVEVVGHGKSTNAGPTKRAAEQKAAEKLLEKISCVED